MTAEGQGQGSFVRRAAFGDGPPSPREAAIGTGMDDADSRVQAAVAGLRSGSRGP
jgi:hypothetical protein